MSKITLAPRDLTLRGIAREAGYGLATVSYALRDHPKVLLATRRKIQAIAQRLGYRPNPLVAAVMAQVRAANPLQHGGTIACLACWREAASELNSRANALFLTGAHERAAALGWSIDEIACDDYALRGKRLTGILTSRGIHGILVGPMPSNRGEIDFDWRLFACATWGYSLRTPILHRAVVHHGHSIALAFRRAQAAGAKRIGLAMPARINARSDYLYEATCFLQQKELRPANRPKPFFPENNRWTQSCFLRWLDREKPDVIITPNDVRRWLAAAGRRARDVGVITLDKTADSPPGAGVDYCHEAVGAAAIDLILTQINANERGIPQLPKLVLIEGRWVDGPLIGWTAPDSEASLRAAP